MLLVSADEMRELDRRTIEDFGIPGIVLMERAGLAVANTIEKQYFHMFPGPIAVMCGKGNNGGDGFVIGRVLADRGWQIDLFLAAEKTSINGDAAIALNAFEKSGFQIFSCSIDSDFLDLYFSKYSLIVDALLGTGLTDDVRGISRSLIDRMNEAVTPVLAVDIPSGIDSSTGKICGIAVKSDSTVTFAAAKPGHYVWPAAGYIGNLVVSDIGIPRKLLPDHLTSNASIDARLAKCLLPNRSLSGHKGTFGHLLILAGSKGMVGAAELAVRGGLRSGAGLVSLACDEEIQPISAGKLTESMTLPLSTWSTGNWSSALNTLNRELSDKDALCIGPGLGRNGNLDKLLPAILLSVDIPLILDADALVIFESNVSCLKKRSSEVNTVITPHPGELSRILSCSVQDIESNRLQMAQTAAELTGCVIVLKGAGTIVADPSGKFRVNTSGNQGMATGGMGDVLAGLIGGLMMQDISAFDAACLGVYLHGAAGDFLSEEQGHTGLLASELASKLPIIVHQLDQMEEQCVLQKML